MTCILDLVTNICPEIEAQIKPRLGGLTGMFISGYLPQTWVLVTESETVTLRVDGQGNAWASVGGAAQPDVTITTIHAVLSVALGTRNRAAVPQGPLHVVPHTLKGKAAFQFMRGKLGL